MPFQKPQPILSIPGSGWAAARTLPLIREEDELIYLYFDARGNQSAMNTQAPFDLVFSYTKLMMGFLLFMPVPRDILIVGLGGGSLSKYCHRHLPKTRITTVEISEAVIALRDRFLIPSDDERFRIVHGDGAEYIAANPHSADVILLDGFDADGIPAQLCSEAFYERCSAALRRGGVLAANVMAGDWRVGPYITRLRKIFDDRVLHIRSERGFNQVFFALKREKLPTWGVLRDRALDLEQQHDLNFRTMLAQLLAGMNIPA